MSAQQISDFTASAQEAVLRETRRLAYKYGLRLEDVQVCPGGYLLRLKDPHKVNDQLARRIHLLAELELDDEGTHALVPHLEGWARFITPPRTIAVCSHFTRGETAAYMRKEVLGPTLAAGFNGGDQLFLHMTETSDVLKLEESEPNSLKAKTYAELKYGYLFRAGATEVFDYLSLEPPPDPEQTVTTVLGGTYLYKPFPPYGDFLATLILSPSDAQEVAAIYCPDSEAERAVRDLKRWQKSIKQQNRKQSR